ncbi:MAG: hypothetical protein GX660_11110 [Clostridiaceae bacterium]|nr:hypothetical protein [Clostridiaceae bacterium]
MIINEPVKVGLRDKRTDELVAVFPENLKGDRKEIDKKVFDWYYKQSCSAEDELRNLYVDIIES